MLEVLTGLFDPTGFTRRADCGAAWTPALISLHATSDYFIWLAYVSIPLVLLSLTRRRELPFPKLFVLFALFILACGTTHLLDALMFQFPVYRFAGVMKAVTAGVSWVTVIALVRVIPRVMPALTAAAKVDPGTKLHVPLTEGPKGVPWGDYIVAVLAAVAALLVRGALDPLLKKDHIFVVPLLAVVYVSWQTGLKPALVTLVIGVVGYSYFFISAGEAPVIERLGAQLAIALFFFCGVACAALGEAQRVAQRRARDALAAVLARQVELEAEVTRRKAVEAALRQREDDLTAARNQTAEALARLNAFIDNAPVGIVFFDRELRYERINTFLAEANGKPVAEHIGRKLTDVLPDFPPELVATYARIAAGEAGVFSGVVERPNRTTGRYQAWQLTAFPVQRPNGPTLGAGVVIHDITERLKAEYDLRRSEERYRMLTEAVPHIVWNADAAGEVNYFNQRWIELTALPVEQAQGSAWMNAIHPEDRERVYRAWRLTVNSATPGGADRFSNEFRLRTAGTGAYRWVQSVAVPVRYADGRIDQWIGSMADIDDQKRHTEVLERMVRERTRSLEQANGSLVDEVAVRKAAEEQLRAVAVELGRSNSELEKFAYIASHDLQEPLRKIQAFGDRLVTKCRDVLPESGKEYVDRMLVAAGRMRRLIDDLLTFSRVTTQQRAFRWLDTTKLVREVVSDLEVRIGQANGMVVVGPLPRIAADPSQMRQLFQNLIANAVKFQQRGVPPVVEIAGEVVPTPPTGADGEPVPTCRITVRDNGIGFDEKYRERIFEVFQRLHGRDEYEGTGVGLAICRKIVERHGGQITAHSREGEGATFVVLLPVRQTQTQQDADDDAPPEQADHGPHGG